jgi:RNA methyltransferase, TrmH family
MLSKNQLKHLTSLRLKKFRELHGEFLAEGDKTVAELLGSAFDVKELFALTSWLHENADLVNRRSLKVNEISHSDLERISTFTTPNKVVALSAIPRMPEQSAEMFSDLILALDNIRDPGNLGTIIRTADWFGIRHIVCSPGCVDVYNPKVVQSSMGSITRTNLYSVELAGFLQTAPSGITSYGCLLEGQNLHTIPLKTPAIIIIGNESNGISDELLPFITERLSIPSFITGDTEICQAESLNASLANAIVCYEFRRRQAII